MFKSLPRPVLLALQFAVLAGIVGWIYWPALHGTWLWDDGLEVAQNSVLRDPRGWWLAWLRPTGLDYLPLKTDFQWLEWHRWGGSVAGYHAANIILHGIGAGLLWRLLARLGVAFAWLGALLFAVHPQAVESVAWISEFKNVLSFPLGLLSVLAFLRWIDRAGGEGWSLAAAWLAFAGAMLVKTSAAPLPLALLVLAWWRGRSPLRRTAVALLPFLAVSIALGLVTLHCQWTLGMRQRPGAPAVMGDWIRGGSSLALDLRDALWPRWLSPVYAPVRSAGLAAAAALLFAASTAVFLACRRTWGGAALVASAWYFGCLLPILGLVPMAYLRVAPRADHLAYLSLAAVAGGAAAAASVLWARGGRIAQAAVGALCVAGLLALALTARSYAAAFADPASLWKLAVAREPGAWVAHANLGRADLDAGQWSDAAAQLSAAASLQPNSAAVRTDWANALRRLGESEAAEEQYRAAVRIAPGFAGARYDYGEALLNDGQPAAAAEELRAAVALDPRHAAAHNNLGLALMRLGEPARAVEEYRAAIRLEPSLAEAHLNLANAYLRQDDAARAVEEYRAAIAIHPHYRAAHLNLSQALLTLGRMHEAEAEIEAAEGR